MGYSQMGFTPKAGGLYRKLREQRSKLEAIPEGKGAIGTMTRNLVEEPIERPVAPGAKKVVAVKTGTQMPEERGIMPQSMASAGQVAGPSAMGMISPVAARTSRIAPRATSNKGGAATPAVGTGGAVGTPAGVSLKPKTVSKGGKAVASAPTVLGSQAPMQGQVSGSYTAGPGSTTVKIPSKTKAPSASKQIASNTNIKQLVSQSGGVLRSLQKAVSNPTKAVGILANKAVKTVQNVASGNPKAYQSSVTKQAEKAKAKVIKILRSFFG
jgi:hypothetical protein